MAIRLLVSLPVFTAVLSVLACHVMCFTPRVSSDEENLLAELFDGYNPSARPVLNSSETVEVNLQFSLLQIQELNVRSQVLTTTGLLILNWKDERLTWDSSISDLDEVVVHGSNIWRPEFAVINGAEGIYGEYKEFQAVLRPDGSIRWEPGGVFKTMCTIDITYYPFDSQRCDLLFGAWSYYTTKMNLTTNSTAIIMDTYETNGEWEIEETAVKRDEFFFECCQHQRFSNIAFTIYLRRRHTFYIMNVILPGILTSAVLLSIFFCTPSQKVHIGVAALLSFRLFLLNVADTIPRTSDHVPLLGIYLTCTMAITTMAMVATVFVGNLYEMKEKPVPGWAKRLFIVHLARLMCMCNCLAPLERNSSEVPTSTLTLKSSTSTVAAKTTPLLRYDSTAIGARLADRGGSVVGQCSAVSNSTSRCRMVSETPSTNRCRSRDGRAATPPDKLNVQLMETVSAGHNNSNSNNSYHHHQSRSVCQSQPTSNSRRQTSPLSNSREDHSSTSTPTLSSPPSAPPPVEVDRTVANKPNYAKDWVHVAAVCDRLFFWMCLTFIVVTTLLLFHPLTTSQYFKLPIIDKT